jgi:flagellar biosynthesis protein FliP
VKRARHRFKHTEDRAGASVKRFLLLVAVLLIASTGAAAQQLNVDFGGGGSMSGRVVQLVALITVLTLAPSILVVVTSFTRIVIVLSMLRTAIGVMQTPPNVVVIGLALFLTGFIMAPTLERAYKDGVAPLLNEEIDETQAFNKATQPFAEFMARQVREKDLGLFLALAKLDAPVKSAEAPLRVLVPAFMISELKRAFEIGFLIFVPFIVIDMVVASLLMAMGMMMLPPVSISLPFKLIFFVLVDGWNLITASLVQSFGPG